MKSTIKLLAIAALLVFVSGCQKIGEAGLGNNNEREYVDLGLPSGLLWATCNVGASSPYVDGDYFAWGETKTKSTYTEDNSTTYDIFVTDFAGNAQYDVARKKWGGKWRMPKKTEFEELIEQCTWTWTSQDGNVGYKVTGPNDDFIFLPAAGRRNGSSLINTNTCGYYWSSTPQENFTLYAYDLLFSIEERELDWGSRYQGRTVRPVMSKNEEPPEPPAPPIGTINGHDYVDLGLSSGLKWATSNVGSASFSDYGDYYAWGETETKAEYLSYNCTTFNEQISEFAGDAQYDVARKEWGASWRMPKESEFEELISQCTWTWTSQDGHGGYKVIGRNGNFIFLPAAGYRFRTALDDEGTEGYYWSSTPREGNIQAASILRFTSSYIDINLAQRFDGRSVRPVSD